MRGRPPCPSPRAPWATRDPESHQPWCSPVRFPGGLQGCRPAVIRETADLCPGPDLVHPAKGCRTGRRRISGAVACDARWPVTTHRHARHRPPALRDSRAPVFAFVAVGLTWGCFAAMAPRPEGRYRRGTTRPGGLLLLGHRHRAERHALGRAALGPARWGAGPCPRERCSWRWPPWGRACREAPRRSSSSSASSGPPAA